MSKKKAITDKSVRNENGDVVHGLVSLDGLYENWFLDYASYVILERAVPRIED
jgi:topoisomerase-4 subunit A